MVSSGPSLTRALLTGVAVGVLLLPFVVGVTSLTALQLWTAPVIVAVIAVLVAVAVVARHREAGEDDGGTVWDAIPDWQYDGRHVESGGLARDEQERALRDVQEQVADKSGRNDA